MLEVTYRDKLKSELLLTIQKYRIRSYDEVETYFEWVNPSTKETDTYEAKRVQRGTTYGGLPMFAYESDEEVRNRIVDTYLAELDKELDELCEVEFIWC